MTAWYVTVDQERKVVGCTKLATEIPGVGRGFVVQAASRAQAEREAVIAAIDKAAVELALRTADWSLSKAAHLLGIDRAQLTILCKRLEVNTLRPLPPPAPSSTAVPVPRRAIVALHAKGWGDREIAKHLSCNIHLVQKVLREPLPPVKAVPR